MGWDRRAAGRAKPARKQEDVLFAALLKSIVRRGSMVLADGAERRHRIGDGSAPRVAVRPAWRYLDYTLALNPKLAIGEAYMRY